MVTKMVTNEKPQSGKPPGFFKGIERLGNKLPNPFLLFIYLIVLLAISTAVLSLLHVSVLDPIKKEPVFVKNILGREGLQWFFPNLIKNFSGFTPLGSILALMLGVGLAEKVGLLDAIIRKMALKVSAKYASYLVVFIAIFSHISSDAALVIMPPLGALIFLAVGRHPVAGLLAAIAGVSSGFTANLLLVTTDVLLSGISSEFSKTINPKITVSVLDNWFFMAASVFLLTFLAGFITDKFVEPRLGKYQGKSESRLEKLTEQQNKALRATGIAALIFIVVIALMVVPHGAILRDPKTDSIMPSPFMSGIVPIIMFFFFTVALTYGYKVEAIKQQNDIPKLLQDPIKHLAGFIVMAFPLSQFVALFNWSNMGKFIALFVTDVLEKLGITGAPVFIGLIFLSSFLCLFIASGSAIWSILAPVFVPLLMLLGYHPAFAQLIFRVADSTVNSIAIISPFVPLFLGYLQEYRSDAKLGTYYSLIMPYVIAIYIAWVAMVIIWYFLGLPIGPGVYPKL